MRLRLRAEAAEDLEAIHSYIARDNSDAATAAVRRVQRALEQLLLFPKSGRNGVVPGTRELIVPGLPYIIVYTISEDTIDVIGVAHAAQDRP